MFWMRLFLFLIAPLLLALAAPMLLLWAWGNGLPLLPALLVSILLLSAALVVALLGLLSNSSSSAETDALWTELEKLRAQVQRLDGRGHQPSTHESPAGMGEEGAQYGSAGSREPASTAQMQIGQASRQTTQDEVRPQAPSAAQTAAMAAMALSPDDGTADTATPEKPAPPQEARIAAIANAHASGYAQPPRPPGLEIYMEPVMDLASGHIAGYRALPALPAEEGKVYLGWQAHSRARLTGQAGAMQVHLLADCLRFMQALQAHGHAGRLHVFCSLDVALLAQPRLRAPLQDQLQRAGHAAGHVLTPVLEARALHDSSSAARQHLLDIAALVQGFSLEHATLPDAEAPLPVPLHVLHVEVPASALGMAGHLADLPAWRAAWQARGAGIIINAVDDEAALLHARAVAQLARGREVGLPRRMRLPDLSAGPASRPQLAADTTFPASKRLAGAAE